MNKGLIKVLFEGGGVYTVEIAVHTTQNLQAHHKWHQLKSWWLFDNDSTCLVTWDDGSEVLLTRDKILSISMTITTPLEIM